MSEFVVSMEYGKLVVEESDIPSVLHASAKCGGCGLTVGCPKENRFTDKKSVEKFYKDLGWRNTHAKGRVCKNCKARIDLQRKLLHSKRRKRGFI